MKKWVAVGDSFIAGPGAGKEWDPHPGFGKCMRRTEAYAPHLQRDSEILGPDGQQSPKGHSAKPEFIFAACTGAKTRHMLGPNDKDRYQLNKITEDTTLVILSIGGNDAKFSKILKACVYGATNEDPKKACEARKQEDYGELYGTNNPSDTFHKRYNQLLQEILNERLRWVKSDQRTVIYQTSYPMFFDDFTSQCDKTNFIGVIPRAPKIVQKLRKSLICK